MCLVLYNFTRHNFQAHARPCSQLNDLSAVQECTPCAQQLHTLQPIIALPLMQPVHLCCHLLQRLAGVGSSRILAGSCCQCCCQALDLCILPLGLQQEVATT